MTSKSKKSPKKKSKREQEEDEIVAGMPVIERTSESFSETARFVAWTHNKPAERADDASPQVFLPGLAPEQNAPPKPGLQVRVATTADAATFIDGRRTENVKKLSEAPALIVEEAKRWMKKFPVQLDMREGPLQATGPLLSAQSHFLWLGTTTGNLASLGATCAISRGHQDQVSDWCYSLPRTVWKESVTAILDEARKIQFPKDWRASKVTPLHQKTSDVISLLLAAQRRMRVLFARQPTMYGEIYKREEHELFLTISSLDVAGEKQIDEFLDLLLNYADRARVEVKKFHDEVCARGGCANVFEAEMCSLHTMPWRQVIEVMPSIPQITTFPWAQELLSNW